MKNEKQKVREDIVFKTIEELQDFFADKHKEHNFTFAELNLIKSSLDDFIFYIKHSMWHTLMGFEQAMDKRNDIYS